MAVDVVRSSPGLVVAAHTLRLDALAARATAALSAAGIPSILLKGRSIAVWLYPDADRDYRDVDLLVHPRHYIPAQAVLGRLGLRNRLARASDVEFGRLEIELVSDDGQCVDLHRGLIGTRSPELCWSVLSANTDRLRVAGRWVTVLSEPARTMHLALHAAQNGPKDGRAVRDLALGLNHVPFTTWWAAYLIATQLGAVDAFCAGLVVLPLGRDLIERLGANPRLSTELLLRTSSAPPQALQIEAFRHLDGPVARAAFVIRKLWPTAAYMALQHPGCTDSRVRLQVARLRRLAGLPALLWRAWRSWSKARRAVRSNQVVHEDGTTKKGWSA